jgi:hypothetical protein
LVPPAGLLGGWLCFFASMAVIRFLTAIIGDLAATFGCLVGLKDGVTGNSHVYGNFYFGNFFYGATGNFLTAIFGDLTAIFGF